MIDFQKGLKKMGGLLNPERFAELMKLTSGTTILIDQFGWLVAKSTLIPAGNNTIAICEKPQTSFFRNVGTVRIVSSDKD